VSEFILLKVRVRHEVTMYANGRGPVTRNTVHTVTSQWLLEALSPRAKGPGLEADHSAPSSAKVKNE
jgi:hypothetical protein